MVSMHGIEAFLHQLPKVELHCHLFGSVREQTLRDLARREQAPLADDEISAFYTRGDKPVGVLRVLRALDAHLVRRPDDLHRLVYEYLQDAAAHQVRYAEFFWNPTGTAAQSGIAYTAALPAIVRAIDDAQHDHRITGRLIAAIDREASPEAATEMVQWVIQHRVDEVLGIGIDYREVDRPPELFAEAYALARRAGLKTTAHAGEFGMPWTNVHTAVELLQVDRIDHGYTPMRRLAQPISPPVRRPRHRLHRGADQLLLPAHAWRRSAGRSTTRSAACPAWACASTPTPTTRRCTMSRRPGPG